MNFRIFSVDARSLDLCPVGNELAPYLGLKHIWREEGTWYGFTIPFDNTMMWYQNLLIFLSQIIEKHR